MTQQSIEPIRMDGKRFILLLLLLFGAGVVLLGICRLLIELTGIGLFDALFLAAAIALLFAVIRVTTLRYVYVVDESSVKIMKAYGDKINTLVELRASDVLGVVKVEAGTSDLKQYRSVTWMAPKKRVNAALVYRQDGAAHALMIAPNEEILAALRAQKQVREVESRKENA